MNNFGNFVVNVAINREPYTKKWQTANGNGEYDILPGLIIPASTKISSDKINEVEFKISREMMGNVKKNVLEISKLILKNEEKLKNGNLYAKVTCYMAPIKRNGVTNMFTPYINDIELVQPSDEDKIKVIKALSSSTDAELLAY